MLQGKVSWWTKSRLTISFEVVAKMFTQSASGSCDLDCVKGGTSTVASSKDCCASDTVNETVSEGTHVNERSDQITHPDIEEHFGSIPPTNHQLDGSHPKTSHDDDVIDCNKGNFECDSTDYSDATTNHVPESIDYIHPSIMDPEPSEHSGSGGFRSALSDLEICEPVFELFPLEDYPMPLASELKVKQILVTV